MVRIIRLLAAIVVLVAASSAKADDRQALLDDALRTLEGFLAAPDAAGLKSALKQAHGVFIVPQLVKAGVFVGGSGGSGVVLARDKTWSDPAFYSLGGLTLTFQLGAETAEVVMVMLTPRSIAAILATEATIGTNVSFVDGSSAGEAALAEADIVVFRRSAGGAFAGPTVAGASIRARTDWNRTFYGMTASSRDVLVRRITRSNKAVDLKNALDRATR